MPAAASGRRSRITRWAARSAVLHPAHRVGASGPSLVQQRGQLLSLRLGRTAHGRSIGGRSETSPCPFPDMPSCGGAGPRFRAGRAHARYPQLVERLARGAALPCRRRVMGGRPVHRATVAGAAAVAASQGKLKHRRRDHRRTIAGEVGGLVGYAIGNRYGRSLVDRPGKRQERRQRMMEKGEQAYARWAVSPSSSRPPSSRARPR